MQDPEGQWEWGRWRRGEEQGRRRVDERSNGVGKEDDYGEEDYGGTGARARRRRSNMDNTQVSSDGAGGGYRVEGSGREESADESAK